MKNNKFIHLFITIMLLLFSSCVSKKKFIEMQDGRIRAEEQVRKLTEENNYQASRIEALITDFENMKNELMESNAIKDQYIDSLSNEIFKLEESLVQQKESFQETSFTFGFERQRMNEEMKAKDNLISNLRSQIGTLGDEISEKASVIDEKNFQLNLLNDKISTLQAEKQQGEQQIDELQQSLKTVQKEVEAMNLQIREKDETIARLQNNVDLLKRELGRD